MSRSKKKLKQCGKDFTSRRLAGYPTACKISKNITVRKERMRNKQIIKKELEDNNER